MRSDGDPCASPFSISCIGRRLLMGQRTIDEIEAAGAELGPDTLRLGFYSYGEISPHAKSGLCELHNQTMTVTDLRRGCLRAVQPDEVSVVHKLLAQQIAKATDETGSVDLEKLFALVTDAYEDVDRDRRRTDRSMSLMIEEIDAVQRNLEQTVIERTKELREREAELQAQNMRFDAAISNMSQGLVMFDSQTRGSSSAISASSPCIGLEADGIRPGDTLRHLLERRIANGTFSGDAEPLCRQCAAPWSKPGSRPRSSSSWMTAGPSRSSISPCRAAAGWRPTKTSPSGGRRK